LPVLISRGLPLAFLYLYMSRGKTPGGLKRIKYFILNIMRSSIVLISSILFCHCNNSEIISKNLKTVYYRDFDIFNLKGIDTLNKSYKQRSVEVRYESDKPIYIKYNKSKRVIILALIDSFSINNSPIYIYTTSNFQGGPPGRHKVYTGHSEEYKDFVYVSFSDTLVVETRDVPQTRNFHFDLYIKEEPDKIIITSAGETDYFGENAKLTSSQLYLKWFPLLEQKYKKDISDRIIINELPSE